MFTRVSVIGAVVLCSLDAASAYVGSFSGAAGIRGRAASRIAARPLRDARATRRSATSLAMSDNDFKDWKATTAFLFPGQGAQYVGMAGQLVKDVPKAKEMFDTASDVLGYDLLKMCLEGPKEKLDSTVISQPAIYVASLAAVEKLRMEAGQEAIDKATVAAGLSLGEYTALSFAGAISFEDGLKIVKVRGEAMQAASEASESGMVSVIGLDRSSPNPRPRPAPAPRDGPHLSTQVKRASDCPRAQQRGGGAVRQGVGALGREDPDRQLPLPGQLRRLGRQVRLFQGLRRVPRPAFRASRRRGGGGRAEGRAEGGVWGVGDQKWFKYPLGRGPARGPARDRASCCTDALSLRSGALSEEGRRVKQARRPGADERRSQVAEIAKPDFKARMTVPLAVAGAFHTDFMAPAVASLAQVLDDPPPLVLSGHAASLTPY